MSRMTIAYFSMEVALENHLPTYSGGLGVLAGDTLRTAADLGLPMAGVTLLHRRGYFFQRLDGDGTQHEEPVAWPVDDFLEPLDARCAVTVAGRPVVLRAWRYRVTGVTGATVPVFLLDADLADNAPEDRRLTDHLYGGDARYRLGQEIVLGIGGVRMLRALGHQDVDRFHMNEGHSALLGLELLREALEGASAHPAVAVERVRRRCVFTTHTPVPAGHDQFPVALAEEVLGAEGVETLRRLECCRDVLNTTQVALRLSHYVNGVSQRHGEVSSSLFPEYPIGSITNGVHSVTWTSPAFQALYDRHLPGWRRDAFSLRYALSIPLDEMRQAHREAKRRLIERVNGTLNAGFDADVFTLGFARRSTAYKRPDLLFRDPGRLRRIAAEHGPLQIVFAGKAHPRDEEGKALIRTIFHWAAALKPEVAIAYLPNHDMALGRLLTAGADVWLNTPKPPWEASGTSGMKAAHNGVPSLSVLDGWWWEGYVEGVTGWSIDGNDHPGVREASDDADAGRLYGTLEQVAPLWSDPERWAHIMRATIALNASFFNTQRMLGQYVALAYHDAGAAEPPIAAP
jgi:starch phosphorylase